MRRNDGAYESQHHESSEKNGQIVGPNGINNATSNNDDNAYFDQGQ